MFSICGRLLPFQGFPGGSDSKASACNEGDPGSVPGLGRSPGEGNGNPLQYTCLENPMDGGAWWATVHGVAKSRTRLNNFTLFCFTLYIKMFPNTTPYKVLLKNCTGKFKCFRSMPLSLAYMYVCMCLCVFAHKITENLEFV